MGKLKELWQRFRQWQREPLHFKPLKDETHVCLNCGLEYVGLFCPRCGQKAKTKLRLGWNALKDDIFNTFDIEATSLARTLWHLLWRPGYLIDDYLNGKRKVCTPPINTLIMLGVLYMLVKTLLVPETEPVEMVATSDHFFIETANNWGEQNVGWKYLFGCSFALIPTWVLFHHSPRHPRHTLVEGFFIQVFMFMLMMEIFIILMIAGQKTDIWGSVLWPFYYTFALGAVFGYNWWSTLWRSVLFILVYAMMFVSAPFIVDIVRGHPKSAIIWQFVLILLGAAAILMFVGFMIGRHTERRRKQKT